jgi:hypothetical protein
LLTEIGVLVQDEQAIRARVSGLVEAWAAERVPPFTGESAEGFAEAITVAHLVADEGRLTLQRWVDAARRTGLSWAEIGQALGISKQAAQQRFRPGELADEQLADSGDEIVRLGATAFNELKILREEGLRGRELMRVGALALVFRPSGRRWEYLRRVAPWAAPEAVQAAEGWTHVGSWLPFQYYKRPIGH